MKAYLLLLVFGAALLAGCDDGGPDPVEYEDPVVDTADKLMANFQDIYEGMLIDDFREMLHPDHKLMLSPTTLSDWGWAEGTAFDRDTMIIIHENMFSGSPGIGHLGEGIDPLDLIVIELFENVSGWSLVSPDAEYFPGTSRALYRVSIIFNDNTGNHAFVVEQDILFYAASVDGVWYLEGIVPMDVSLTKDMGTASYGAVLALYR